MKCPPFIFLNSLLFLGHIIICFFYSCNHNTGTVLFSFKTVILNPFFLSPYNFPEGYTPVVTSLNDLQLGEVLGSGGVGI